MSKLRTLFRMALQSGVVTPVSEQLKRGASPSDADERWWTPLRRWEARLARSEADAQSQLHLARAEEIVVRIWPSDESGASLSALPAKATSDGGPKFARLNEVEHLDL